jgi:hypothetical protein
VASRFGQVRSDAIFEHSEDVGLVEVAASAMVIDFGTRKADPELELNGLRFRAGTPAELGAAVAAHGRDEPKRLFSINYDVVVEDTRVVITPTPSLGAFSDTCLAGADAESAIDRAELVLASAGDAWPLGPAPSHTESEVLSGLADEGGWDGPLVVSMPRTGSTLMGILFLFAGVSRGASVFRRYVHEPAAPVFWRGDDPAFTRRFVDRLGPADVVQESAYQFAHPEIAAWFLRNARRPVVFTVRHPQLSWPSRWRAMLSQLVAEQPGHPLHAQASVALESRDYAPLGEFLTTSVRPPDNGFYSFIWMLDLCLREGIDFILVDNTRFRDRPEATLRALCERLDVAFDPAMVEWSNLDMIRERIVMSDLASGDEYRWYYEGTVGSRTGIRPETHEPVPGTRFPDVLRGVGGEHLSIDEATTWYRLLLSRPEAL